MRVDVYHHGLGGAHDLEKILHEIRDRVAGLGLQGAQIMASNEEALAVVNEIKVAVVDVADDVNKLMVLAQQEAVSAELMTALTGVRDTLAGVAAQFPPAAPTV